MTLALVPRGQGRLLEIGANPYFLTVLLKRFRAYQLTLTNYYNGEFLQGEETVVNERYGEVHELPYWQVNVERDTFPFEDQAFQVVLFCEVLEHLLEDPMHALLEIRRVLAPEGSMILTTPNVGRLSNLLELLRGEKSIYDPYSRHGPYGRHNREYTLTELRQLVEEAGFQVGKAFTADVHGTDSLRTELARWCTRLDGERGEYCFLVARPTGRTGERRPSRFYR